MGDKKKVSFDKTPIMSTYLLAWVIGEFEYVEGKTKRGTQVRVYTPMGKKNKGQFALKVGIESLEYYERLCSKLNTRERQREQ